MGNEPRARCEPVVRHVNGVEFVDEFAWLRMRDRPDVFEHLERENAWTERVLGHTRELQERLYEEMLSRIKEDDESVPVRIDGYEYFSRTENGKAYPIHCRRKSSVDAPEEVFLDENLLAEGHEYFRLGAMAVSPDHRWLAYCSETDGSERYVLRVKNLEDGRTFGEPVTELAPSIAWASDSRTLLLVRLDTANRPWQVLVHEAGSPAGETEVVYEETDQKFFVSVGRTRSKRFLLVASRSSMTSEVRFVDAKDPRAPLRLLRKRVTGVEYDVGHRRAHFYVRTNLDAKNFRLMKVSVEGVEEAEWEEVVPHRPEVKLERVDLFEDQMVRIERTEGLRRLVVHSYADGKEHEVDLPESVYSLSAGSNPDFGAGTYRFSFSSLVTPSTVFDYHVTERRLEIRKVQEVVGEHDPSRYETVREYASAADGTRVPISLVYRRDTPLDGNAPCLLYGYGAYGISLDPAFSSVLLSLLDRGFVYAIAHVRGGGELGEGWHDAGRLEHKPNTFSDFIAAADHLVMAGWCARDRLVIRGGSAGGLLVGAVLNARPDLCGAAIAHVPFVDIVNTMLDESLPLTVTEYEEWGDPRTPDVLARLLAYSPYDNVKPVCYPHLLVTAGINDPRVQYWEPAKWVARLRDRRTCRHRLLLKTNMGAGHSGPSGRYGFLRERALEYAFALDSLNLPYCGAAE